MCQLRFPYIFQSIAEFYCTSLGCMTNPKSQVLAKLASVVMAVLLLAGPVHCQSLQTLTDVEMVGSTTDSPPAGNADWQRAQLAYFSSFTKADSAPDYVWVRFWLPAASDGNTQALFIARHMCNVDLYVNGVRLYSERAGDYIGWNTPLLVELQPATLQH